MFIVIILVILVLLYYSFEPFDPIPPPNFSIIKYNMPQQDEDVNGEYKCLPIVCPSSVKCYRNTFCQLCGKYTKLPEDKAMYNDEIKLIDYGSYFNYPANQKRLDLEYLQYLK